LTRSCSPCLSRLFVVSKPLYSPCDAHL
jgi:hypothetical protein